MTSTSSVTVFPYFLFFLFSSSRIYYLFCRKLQQQTGRGRVGWDRTGRRGQRQGGTGDRRAGGGGRRRGEGGLAGNMETAEAEDKADGRTSKSERRLGNMAVVLPRPWLFGQDMDIVFLKSNAVK